MATEKTPFTEDLEVVPKINKFHTHLKVKHHFAEHTSFHFWVSSISYQCICYVSLDFQAFLINDQNPTQRRFQCDSSFESSKCRCSQLISLDSEDVRVRTTKVFLCYLINTLCPQVRNTDCSSSRKKTLFMKDWSLQRKWFLFFYFYKSKGIHNLISVNVLFISYIFPSVRAHITVSWIKHGIIYVLFYFPGNLPD